MMTTRKYELANNENSEELITQTNKAKNQDRYLKMNFR